MKKLIALLALFLLLLSGGSCSRTSSGIHTTIFKSGTPIDEVIARVSEAIEKIPYQLMKKNVAL